MRNAIYVQTPDLMATDGERHEQLAALSAKFEPASEADVQEVLDNTESLIHLLRNTVEEFQLGMCQKSPSLLVAIYYHLFVKIDSFLRHKAELDVKQFISIYKDYQERVVKQMQQLQIAVIEFRNYQMCDSLDFQKTVDALASGEDPYIPEFGNVDMNQMCNMMSRLVKPMVDKVNNKLEQLMAQFQDLLVNGRNWRSNKDLLYIFRFEFDKYRDNIYPDNCQRDKNYIADCCSCDGETELKVMTDMYSRLRETLLLSALGQIYYQHQDNPEQMALLMSRCNATKADFDFLYKTILQCTWLKLRIKEAMAEERHAEEKEEDELPETVINKVEFTSTENERLVWAKLPEAMNMIKAPKEVACLYHELLFYKRIFPVRFLTFCRWIGENTCLAISESNAEKIRNTYWVKNASVVWNARAAQEWNDTSKMVNEIQRFFRRFNEIHEVFKG